MCYGDSNTWGYISGSDHERYGENERWPKVLGNLLGDRFEIIEDIMKVTGIGQSVFDKIKENITV